MPESTGICVRRNWAVWFTGLPGCGKSTVAKKLVDELRDEGVDVVYLAMDERRKVYIPDPQYTPEEREVAYRLFVEDALSLVSSGRCVVMDGSAHRRKWRDYAREKIRYFAEAHLRCPVDMAMKRESGRQQGLVMAGLYEKALERMNTGKQFPGLGEVIGVDIPFEEDPNAECIVLTENLDADQVLAKVVECLAKWRAMNGIC